MRHADLDKTPCSIARPLAVLGERWTLVVLREVFAGVRRFDDLQQALGVSRGVLSDRLDLLVQNGVLTREPYKDGGRTRHEYRLTDKGRDLFPVLMALRDWGDRYLSGPRGPAVRYHHAGCGGEVRVHVGCDDCGKDLSAWDVAVTSKRRTFVLS